MVLGQLGRMIGISALTGTWSGGIRRDAWGERVHHLNYTHVIQQSPDCLDSACWRCGSTEVVHEVGRPLVCGNCRHALSQPIEDGFEVFRRLFWQFHVLERCWLCLTAAIDPEDDLGLCARCRRLLAEADRCRTSAVRPLRQVRQLL